MRYLEDIYNCNQIINDTFPFVTKLAFIENIEYKLAMLSKLYHRELHIRDKETHGLSVSSYDSFVYEIIYKVESLIDDLEIRKEDYANSEDYYANLLPHWGGLHSTGLKIPDDVALPFCNQVIEQYLERIEKVKSYWFYEFADLEFYKRIMAANTDKDWWYENLKNNKVNAKDYFKQSNGYKIKLTIPQYKKLLNYFGLKFVQQRHLSNIEVISKINIQVQ